MSYIKIFLAGIIGSQLMACHKQLDVKPQKQLVVPSTVADFQALLDAYTVMNNNDGGAMEMSSDDYYVTAADYTALADNYRRTYTWQKENLFPLNAFRVNEWSNIYSIVECANICLDGVDQLERTASNGADWDNLKGGALLFRGKSFLQTALTWAQAYDATTSSTDLGVPLRLNSDFNIPSVRANVEQTYTQIISDLKKAAGLLPVTALHVMRPSKPAAYALLARTYLAMRDYTNAGLYADSCLQLKNTLVDFNTLNASLTYSIPQFNAEVIMSNIIPPPTPLSNSRAKIDSVLYLSYAANDLRKTIFFKNNNNGTYGFRGSYDGSGNLFDGVAVNEVYFIRAEANARGGNTAAAMNDLNAVLIKRWKTGTFSPLTATNAADALGKILLERRKELLMRALRWMDIKRLNKEGANITLKRVIGTDTYTLSPNGNRFALTIPEDVIAITGMIQNP